MNASESPDNSHSPSFKTPPGLLGTCRVSRSKIAVRNGLESSPTYSNRKLIPSFHFLGSSVRSSSRIAIGLTEGKRLPASRSVPLHSCRGAPVRAGPPWLERRRRRRRKRGLPCRGQPYFLAAGEAGLRRGDDLRDVGRPASLGDDPVDADGLGTKRLSFRYQDFSPAVHFFGRRGAARCYVSIFTRELPTASNGMINHRPNGNARRTDDTLEVLHC